MSVFPTTRGTGRSRGPRSSEPSLSNRIVIVWHRSKSKISRLLRTSGTPTVHEPTGRFPYDIMVIIIAHLTHDFRTLKACTLTCRSWYIAAVPHLHHTLNLREKTPEKSRGKLKPLSKLHGLGLTPFVKEIRVNQRWLIADPWFVPRAFSRRDLRSFSAFANVQTLMFRGLDIDRFIPGIERYFEQFSPTLRSITLWDPRCTPRQLSYFLSLFSNLDNVDIRRIRTYVSSATIHDTGLVPFSAPKFRGRLTLHEFPWAGTLKDLIASCGGLRFNYMDMKRVADCAPILLEACAETLETLRLDATDDVASIHSLPSVSRLKVLRSLQVAGWADYLRRAADRLTNFRGVFLTITSPVFSELVIVLKVIELIYLPSDFALFVTLRTMNEVKPFKLVFLFEVPDWLRGEARCRLAEALDSAITSLVTAEGYLDFLDSPPTIRIGPVPYC